MPPREATCQDCGQIVIWYQPYMEAEEGGWVHAMQGRHYKWTIVSSDHEPDVRDVEHA